MRYVTSCNRIVVYTFYGCIQYNVTEEWIVSYKLSTNQFRMEWNWLQFNSRKLYLFCIVRRIVCPALRTAVVASAN